MKTEDIQDKCEICALVTLFIISILAVSPDVYAGPSDDNHVHIEQVNSGDGVDININQIGYDNYINISQESIIDNNNISDPDEVS